MLIAPNVGVNTAIFIAKKMRDELIFNMAKLEGNPLTFAETQTVIHGVSVGGKKMSDLRQVENIRDAWDEIIRQVESQNFIADKQNFIYINSIVAAGENPQLGGFRTKPVSISGTKYMPPLPMLLDEAFREMLNQYQQLEVYQKSFVLFLQTARNQFFADGNKRTGQLMMNGSLMSFGYPPITIEPEQELSYRNLLIDFYETGLPEKLTEFLVQCQHSVRFLGFAEFNEDECKNDETKRIYPPDNREY